MTATQQALAGMEPVVADGLVQKYAAMFRTEPGVDTAVDEQFPMIEFLKMAGATNIEGGYDKRLGAWTFVFTLVYEFASMPGQFVRNLAEHWQGEYMQEYNPLYIHLEVGWYDSLSSRYSLALDSCDLSRLHYDRA